MAFGDAVGATGPVLQGKGGGADFEVAEAEVFKDAELFLEGELALLLAPFGFSHGRHRFQVHRAISCCTSSPKLNKSRSSSHPFRPALCAALT